MKKKIIIIIILGLFICALFLIPRDTYNKIFGKNNKTPKNEPSEKVLVYVNNEEKQLVGINALVYAIEEDEISQKFDILTGKTGIIKDNYSLVIPTETLLEKYSIENGVLNLNVNDAILSGDGKKITECLAWTFCNDEINTIKLWNNDQEINEINNYRFTTIAKDQGINYTFESWFLFEANFSTVIFYNDDEILPVSYFYTDINPCDFIINKIFDENVLDDKKYDYVLGDNSLIIDVSLDTSLDDNIKKSIVETFTFNFELNSITVNGIQSVLLSYTE